MQHRAAPPVQTLVVAGRSARLMVEAAAGDGFRVIALDTYGDQDTRRAAARWLPIGEPGQPIDAQRTLEALTSLRDEPQLVGWVAGSDFEFFDIEFVANGNFILFAAGFDDCVRHNETNER